jgi:chaperonin GroES
MTKTLYVPEYIAKQKEQLKQKPPPKKTEVEAPALEKLPKPTGWRILLLPFKGKKQTEGGILLPDQAIEREALATVCGYVLKVGPLAYKDPEKFGDSTDPTKNWEPWCKEGDWVIFGRYAGSRFKIEGGEVRLLNDDEILATINDPEDILHI